MKTVDLHVHSNKSDGSLSPSMLVDEAVKKGLRAFALTDHDTTEGIEEAVGHSQGKNIEVIPGIEFSTDYHGQDVHIVGLYIDYKSREFIKKLADFIDSRDIRNQKMCALMQSEGIDISLKKVTDENPDSVITRAHFANYLTAHGYVKNNTEAFDKYLGDHSKCYVPREKISPVDAIMLTLKAGGIPILAHPVLYHMSFARLDSLVKELKESGLIGIEALYSTYTPSDERDIKALASKYELCLSGGSDFHGLAKPGLEMGTGYGRLFVPEEILDNLISRTPYNNKIKNGDKH